MQGMEVKNLNADLFLKKIGAGKPFLESIGDSYMEVRWVLTHQEDLRRPGCKYTPGNMSTMKIGVGYGR